MYVCGHLFIVLGEFPTTCFLNKIGISYISVRGLSWLTRRYYSDQIFPKITTHYTIVPRETDSRWKGLYLCMVIYTKVHFKQGTRIV